MSRRFDAYYNFMMKDKSVHQMVEFDFHATLKYHFSSTVDASVAFIKHKLRMEDEYWKVHINVRVLQRFIMRQLEIQLKSFTNNEFIQQSKSS